MKLRLFAFSLFVAGTLAACSSGGTVNPPPIITSSSAPTATPAAIATSIPLAATALQEQQVQTAAPAPPGYTTSVNVPNVTAPANTTIAISAGTNAPTNVPVISTKGRPSVIRRAVSGQYNAIYYDVVVPSASMTAAGTITFTQAFPAGTLSTSQSYYLGFYDGTQSSPTWQTIAGPVSASGNSLMFSGNPGSFTLAANGTYAFCIFSLASNSATPPPSQAADEAYLAQYTNGIVVVNTAGATVNTLAINSNELALDDTGSIYNLYNAQAPSPAPNATSSPTPPPSLLQYYAAGSTAASKTYNVTNGYANFIAASGSGELLAYTSMADNTNNTNDVTIDVWNPGASNAPSYTIASTQNGSPSFDMQHDGTIYVGQNNNANGTFSYLVYPPGSATASRTIPETIVPTGQQANFQPNYMTIGPDGTLYVTEYSYVLGDPLAGLYIYPPNGPEKFVATTSNAQGAGPQGVDLDAAGNIYVANNNAGYDPNNSFAPTPDSLHDVEVFSPGGASVLRHITGAFDPYPIVAGPDGTAFFGSFQGSFGGTNPQGTFVIPAGTTSANSISQHGVESIVLYNGYEESAALRRRASSQSPAASAVHAGAATARRFFERIHRIP